MHDYEFSDFSSIFHLQLKYMVIPNDFILRSYTQEN